MRYDETPRLALFLPSLRGGGAERVMVHLARGFAERGFQVDLVLAKAEGPYLAEVPPSVRVVDLRASRVLFSLPGLVRYLRKERPHALLSALDHANVIVCLAHRLARVPSRLVISEHNTLSASRPQNARGRLLPWFMRWTYPWADAVIAVSQGVAEDLIHLTGLPREKIQVIYNPVVTPELFAKAREPLDHPWLASGEPPVILGVGRLTEQKDFPTLIRAFALVRAQRPARLMILGEGELRPQLEALVHELGLQDDVALPGFVENPYAYMARAAVFVLSSRREGFGNVLVEAMACGTPVVSTDCPSGPREILDHGKYGRLVPVGDVKSLAESILKAMDEPPYRDLSRVAEFTLEKSLERYGAVLGV
ncbi:glycosyl transferase [Thermus scotoductus]|uniref:Glycosyl transferase n=1 Tax=Thermus scotoductus TaxID=37636 RepID=A0A430S992_THESC|nr:glycosyltransferase [Thermus scotoductus]RTH32330.1 glycosyl transferase [Thermus scotoductus]